MLSPYNHVGPGMKSSVEDLPITSTLIRQLDSLCNIIILFDNLYICIYFMSFIEGHIGGYPTG